MFCKNKVQLLELIPDLTDEHGLSLLSSFPLTLKELLLLDSPFSELLGGSSKSRFLLATAFSASSEVAPSVIFRFKFVRPI